MRARYSVPHPVDLTNFQMVYQQGCQWLSQQSESVTIDLQQVDQVHSVLFVLLIGWQRLAHRQQITLEFVGISQSMQQMAACFGLGGVLAINKKV